METENSLERRLWSAFQRIRLHIVLFLNRNVRNTQFLVFTNDEEMRSPFAKQRKCEKLHDMSIYFTDLTRANYV